MKRLQQQDKFRDEQNLLNGLTDTEFAEAMGKKASPSGNVIEEEEGSGQDDDDDDENNEDKEMEEMESNAFSNRVLPSVPRQMPLTASKLPRSNMSRARTSVLFVRPHALFFSLAQIDNNNVLC